MKSDLLRIEILGGADIGKSSALLEAVDQTGQRRFMMIDCGVGFTENGPVPVPLRPRVRPDLLVVTHAHTDHSMMVPKYLADYNCSVLMTGPTFYTLVGGIDRSDGPRRREQAFLLLDHLKVSEMKGVAPVFSRQEYVSFVQSDLVELIYHQDWMEVFPGIWIKFHPAGHIRGAACVFVKTNGHKAMFSGDISKNHTPTVQGMVPPENFHPEVVFLEATNGCANLPDRSAEVKRLVRVAERFRFALIPAFGVGRSPDVALDLAAANFPVFLDGMGQRILLGYAQEEFFWCKNDLPVPRDLLRRIRLVRGEGQRRMLFRDGKPKAVVTTGGMMTGPALSYARLCLGRTDAAVLDVGYAAPGSPAGQLLRKVETGEPFAFSPVESIKIEAHVERFALSAHIDGPQNVELVRTLCPGRIFTGHGERSSRFGLAALLRREGFNAQALEEGQTIEF